MRTLATRVTYCPASTFSNSGCISVKSCRALMRPVPSLTTKTQSCRPASQSIQRKHNRQLPRRTHQRNEFAPGIHSAWCKHTGSKVRRCHASTPLPPQQQLSQASSHDKQTVRGKAQNISRQQKKLRLHQSGKPRPQKTGAQKLKGQPREITLNLGVD